MRVAALVLLCSAVAAATEAPRLPASAHNLLVEAKASGNLEGYKLGMRGKADHMIYDLRQRRFVQDSQWHEYGVG